MHIRAILWCKITILGYFEGREVGESWKTPISAVSGPEKAGFWIFFSPKVIFLGPPLFWQSLQIWPTFGSSWSRTWAVHGLVETFPEFLEIMYRDIAQFDKFLSIFVLPFTQNGQLSPFWKEGKFYLHTRAIIQSEITIFGNFEGP